MHIQDWFAFSNFEFVEPMTRRGGIWFFWKYLAQIVDFVSFEPSLFHSLVTMGPDEPQVVLSTIHAPSSSNQRSQFWNQLAHGPPPSHPPLDAVR